MSRRDLSSATGMAPSINHAPSSRCVAQASTAACGESSPVMASSMSSGVSRPCTTPYSSTTNTMRVERSRNCSSSSMPVRVSGTNTAGCTWRISTSLWPSACSASMRGRWITPTTSSSPPRHTGYQEWPVIQAFCTASSMVSWALSHWISECGTMIEVSWRSSSWNTLRTIWCSCSSIMPASTPSPRLALISSSVTCWTALVSTRNSF
ncbi:hypothetical protein FQZ97_920130 [compost metagenome]